MLPQKNTSLYDVQQWLYKLSSTKKYDFSSRAYFILMVKMKNWNWNVYKRKTPSINQNRGSSSVE